MKYHRFIGDYTIAPGKIKITDKEFINQVRNVLRFKVGEHIVLCDGAMNEATAVITGFGKGYVDINIITIMKNGNEPPRHITLHCSLLKRENFELVVQKATEIGVAEIIPLMCKRTVKLDMKKERLEKIIKEAAEQSGRGIVPLLHNSMKFDEAIKHAKGALQVFFDSRGEMLKVGEWQPDSGIWIGPEGGWDATELEQAKNSDFHIMSLGTLNLRAETAAIVASYYATVYHA